MMQTYKLKLMNESSMAWDFCLFQSVPDTNMPDVMTLAWMSRRVYPGSVLVLEWAPTYNFVWSEQAEGKHFKASQVLDGVDLVSRNQINFDLDEAYTFSSMRSGPRTGSLYITQGPSIPPLQAFVGIGMAEKATFVAPSQPDFELYFTPNPKYYITFGKYAEGDVINNVQAPQVAEVTFDDSFAATKTLNKQNQWV